MAVLARLHVFYTKLLESIDIEVHSQSLIDLEPKETLQKHTGSLLCPRDAIGVITRKSDQTLSDSDSSNEDVDCITEQKDTFQKQSTNVAKGDEIDDIFGSF